MTLNEFKSWLEGFIDGAMDQNGMIDVTLIVEKLRQINAKENPKSVAEDYFKIFKDLEKEKGEPFKYIPPLQPMFPNPEWPVQPNYILSNTNETSEGKY